MRRLNPDYVDRIFQTVNLCPYFVLLSMEIKALDWGQSLVEIAVQEKHFQPFGLVHGGVFSSLIDATAFWAVYTQVDEGLGMTTVELKLNYLAPVVKGLMIGKGRSIRVGKTLCLGEASIEDEQGALLAHGTSTMMILEDLDIQDGPESPPKFLD
jgi:uncharacterized protein (TIGR00369 family)